MIKTGERYIGDGVYASVDEGGGLKLRTPREEGDHWLVVDPGDLAGLLDFIAEKYRITWQRPK
jgi:hypothetical protein